MRSILCALGFHKWKIIGIDSHYVALAHLCGLDHTLAECTRCGKAIDSRKD